MGTTAAESRRTGDGDGSSWKSAPHGTAPDGELLGRSVRLAAEPRNDCLLLGPAGAGKTALLSSFAQACWTGGGGELGPLPLDPLDKLAGAAAEFRRGTGSWPETSETTSYPLQLRTPAGTCFLRVQDEPGRQLFPFSAAYWEGLSIEQRDSYAAKCLVLCVDVADPRPDLWGGSLPPLLARLATPAGPLIPRLSAAVPPRRIDFPRLLTPLRQPPFERVLVALTRADLIVDEALGVFAAGRRAARGRMPAKLSRHELALRIDVLRLLEDLLGAVMGELRAALPTARIAVALTSAWGLEPAGEPWLPFGVSEALLFLASESGNCRPPVVEIERPAFVADVEDWTELVP